MSNVKNYTYRVTWSLDDDEHVGLCAEFPSLSWLDADPIKALQGIMSLVAEVVSDMEKNGEIVPVAFSDRAYSGNIPARVTPMIHRKLAIEAAEKGISMNRLVSVKLAT